MADELEITPDIIKQYNWALKVMGAYVQQPNPAIVGLDQKTIISSNDAAALYPNGIIYSNIGFDTIRHRVYDTLVIRAIYNLITNAFEAKKSDPTAIKSAVDGFTNALDSLLKIYFKTKSIQNKKEAREFTLTYYPKLLRKILDYDGKLEDIFEPKNDETYYLLRSNIYPIFEAITWLHPGNKGYNKITVDYVFFNEQFLKKPQDIFLFMDVNSTKMKFKKLNFQEGINLFKKYIINPYGILFDKHENNLAYDVELLIEALAERKIYKNQMLVLGALIGQWDKLSRESLEYLYSLGDGGFINNEWANKILDEIHDTENREKRIIAICGVEWKFKVFDMEPKKYALLRESQLNIVQLGIKVAANSAYGIFGLSTWQFASPLIGNAITNAGKIYGIKLFQAVAVDILEGMENAS